MEKIHQIFYVSKIAEGSNSSIIEQILGHSKKNNPTKGITGVLMFRAGIFLQLLEGPEQEVTSLFKKIEKDPRHHHVIELFHGKNSRIFNEWSMGYRELTDLDVKMINEILSWNKLINAAKDIDNNLILHMLERFKNALK